MTKDEAWKIVESLKGWNVGQKSMSLAFRGDRTAEDDVLDAKRAALAEAWLVIGEIEK
jgi:hypothetical protein